MIICASYGLDLIVDAFVRDPLGFWPLLILPPVLVWWRVKSVMREEMRALANGQMPHLHMLDAALVAGLKKVNGPLVTTIISAIFAIGFWKLGAWSDQNVAADYAAWDAGQPREKPAVAMLQFEHDLYDRLGTRGALITLQVLQFNADLAGLVAVWHAARRIRTSKQTLYDLVRAFVLCLRMNEGSKSGKRK